VPGTTVAPTNVCGTGITQSRFSALPIRCIVVPAEPFTPPSAKFGRPGALDSSVDCAGLPCCPSLPARLSFLSSHSSPRAAFCRWRGDCRLEVRTGPHLILWPR
jgi:hypothetical protein